jgi:hypothetical protein
MSFFVIKTTKPTITENGKEFLYSINKTSNQKEKKLENIQQFFKARIVYNEKLLTAPAGIYTWILRASGNIFALKIITKQEIGTLHKNLDMLTSPEDSSPIIAAGEFFKKEDGTFQFNLLSGSYMADKKEFKKVRGETNEAHIERVIPLRNILVDNIKAIVSKYDINFQFLECSAMDCTFQELIGGKNIIEIANIRTPKSNLNELNKMFIRTGGKRTRKMLKRYKTRKARSKD